MNFGIRKRNIFVILIIVIFFVGLSLFNNNIKSGLNIDQNSASSVSINEAEQQVQLYKNKQTTIDKIKDEVSHNSLEISKKEIEKIDLERQISQYSIQLQNTQNIREDIKLSLEKLEENKQLYSEKDFEAAKKDIQLKQTSNQAGVDTTRVNYEAAKREMSDKVLEFNSLTKAKDKLRKSLDDKNYELTEQLAITVNTFVVLTSNYFIYFVLLIIYWFIYKAFRYFIHKDVHNPTLKVGSKIAIKAIWIALSLITIFYGLAGQLTYILTSLGFISAALVFALQSFVSSFFVFVTLSITRIIKQDDIIRVGASFEGYTGRVISIGRFYTFLKEINPVNNEEFGRTVAIPNSFLLTHPVTNFTFNNSVIWQNLVLTVRGDSDQEHVIKVLEDVVNSRFKWMKENLVEYLDIEADLSVLNPKVLVSLSDKGFLYNIHFPCRFDKYNDVYKKMLTDIVIKFKEENIQIAFS